MNDLSIIYIYVYGIFILYKSDINYLIRFIIYQFIKNIKELLLLYTLIMKKVPTLKNIDLLSWFQEFKQHFYVNDEFVLVKINFGFGKFYYVDTSSINFYFILCPSCKKID